ncbi:NADH dehydrogenase [Acrocarpospora corrugata]|uniref:NADH dehydrogenase n=1 Tax=Acrocarpospora corrugata TaxID=35763 RepID=A0A5M3W9T0_9ACTN|nr:NADH-quinone oxidoreductase subunit L [Acrocarpospora corrugata]GES05586.1 NADH dehydrogenase [Acrocarpospora corrugata]
MIVAAALIVLLPFAAAVAGLLGSRWPGGVSRTEENNLRANRRAAWFAVSAAVAALALTLWLAWQTSGSGGSGDLFWAEFLPGSAEGTLTVIGTGAIPISVGLQVNGLSVLTAILVTVVALAVQVYSVGYLRGDSRFPSYSAFISLFTSAMLLVVFAADLLVLYVGWEIMGLCSYLLIGHWWEDRANSRAAVKAFLVTRLGDVAFLFGIFTLGFAAGSFRIDDIIAANLPTGTLILATMLLLGGVAGKSAQVPLHTWLPDAMAGPTPISALIHAATMVAAGIFIVARLFPLFPQPTLDVLGVLAAIGMLGAALAAFAQDDLKRILAYSTISQLAYMAAALAAGSPNAAIFHLTSHGAFKALLFLCAGAVIHHVGSNLLSHMGGLRRAMPITFWTMTIGFAALMGLPPTSGFFSKDAVVLAIEHSTSPIRLLLYGSALITVGVTGAYAIRAWLRTFFGEEHVQALAEPAPGTAHVFDGREAPRTMVWPISLLAIPALLFGFIGVADMDWPSAAISLLVALLGAGIVYTAWRSAPHADPARLLGPFRAPCEQAFYLDRAYAALIARPILSLARGVVRTDTHVVDGAVRGSARLTIGLSSFAKLAQNGNAQLYVTGLLAGVLLIAVGAVMWG